MFNATRLFSLTVCAVWLALVGCETKKPIATAKEKAKVVEENQEKSVPMQSGQRMDLSNTLEQMDKRIGDLGLPGFDYQGLSPNQNPTDQQTETSCTVSTDGTRSCEKYIKEDRRAWGE